jgi:putative zinc finger/helix-turn-helix YgiT family protein
MQCLSCNQGTMRPSTVEIRREVGARVFVAAVDGRKCAACGEASFKGTDLARFEGAVAASLARSGEASGEAFRWMRKALDLRAVDVAALLGVTPETISRWETGRVAIDRSALALLALLVLDHERGSAATIDALRARAAAAPLGKTVKIKLAP